MKKVKYLLMSVIALLIMPAIVNAEVKVGDYVEITPTSSSYTVTSAASGCSSDRVLNPKELKLWRIIRKNSNGTFDAVSEYVSSQAICLSRDVGYINLVKTMNEISRAYMNSEYTSGSRIVGFDDQVEVVPKERIDYFKPGTSEQTVPAGFNVYPDTDTLPGIEWDELTQTGGESQSGFAGDTYYHKDLNLISNVYKSDTTTYGVNGLYSYKIGDTDGNADSYWLSSRYFKVTDSSTTLNFCGRYVLERLQYSEISKCTTSGCSNFSPEHGIRPIIVLKSGLTPLAGEGTKTSPYKFEAQESNENSGTSGDSNTNDNTSGNNSSSNTDKKEKENGEIGVKDSDTVDLSKTVTDPSKYNWKSSDESIATVDDKGKVTIKKGGTVVITAEDDNEKIKNKITIYKTPTSKTSSNGVSLLTNDDLTDKDVEMKVSKISVDTDEFKNIKNKVQNLEKMTLYDINLSKNGSKVQPNGEVMLEFDIPDGYDKKKIAVYRVEDNGTLTKLAAKIVNNKIQVKTNHFSYYVVAQLSNETGIEESSAVVSKASTTTENPKTGKTISLVIVSILAIAATAIYFYTKKKNALYRI